MSYRLRRFAARALHQAGTALRAASLSVYRPEDLERLGIEKYSQPRQIERWGGTAVAAQGLTPGEQHLLSLVPTGGNALVLFAGSGREAIALARAGFAVHASDAVPAMLETLEAVAQAAGIAITTTPLSAAQADQLPGGNALAWVGCGMYSTIPLRTGRLEFLRTLQGKLQPGGRLYLSFFVAPSGRVGPGTHRLRTLLATLTGGFRGIEPGDTYWRGAEFVHAFASVDDLLAEASAAGFELLAAESTPSGEGGQVAVLLGRQGG